MTGYLADGPHLAEPSWRCSGTVASSDPCPACGVGLLQGPVPRAAVPHSIAGALLLAGTLSLRERAVFELLGQGYGNRSIAREMSISERTVKRHITIMLSKLGLESRLQAGLAALIISAVSEIGATWPEDRMAAGPPRG